MAPIEWRVNRNIEMNNKEKPSFTSPNVQNVHEIGKEGFDEVSRSIVRFTPIL